jgi:hypothetical protein
VIEGWRLLIVERFSTPADNAPLSGRGVVAVVWTLRPIEKLGSLKLLDGAMKTRKAVSTDNAKTAYNTQIRSGT